MPIINIAGYQFVSLSDLTTLKDSLFSYCEKHGFKGTILLSEEGINLSLANIADQIEPLIAFLQTYPSFANMNYRRSESDFVPFKQLKVKIKKEIITMLCPEVQPIVATATHLAPKDLKQWLDENRDIQLLDTRNGYEVRFGTFAKAQHAELDDFSEFTKRDLGLSKSKPTVMFCTGGVRCEKAGAYLLQQGFEHVYQLDGGILNYFSEVGAAHYEGECFVFDRRISVDTDLAVSGTQQCINCEGPIKASQSDCECRL